MGTALSYLGLHAGDAVRSVFYGSWSPEQSLDDPRQRYERPRHVVEHDRSAGQSRWWLVLSTVQSNYSQ